MRRINNCYHAAQNSHSQLFWCITDFGGSLDSLAVKESTCNTGDLGSIPEWGRSPGEGNDKPLQYPCLGNPKDRGGWRATVHGITRAGENLAIKSPPPV